MACPTVEDVTRELIRRLQVHFAAVANVYGSSGVTSIEVTDATGAPLIEPQDKPQVSVMGPTMRAGTRFGTTAAERVVVSTDPNTLSGIDAPAPLTRHCDYQLVCTAMRDSTSASGKVGIQWLEQQITFFGMTGGGAGPYLLGDGWTGDEAPGRFRGYLFELSSEPRPIPSAVADLRGFNATLTVKDVRITDGSNGALALTGTLNLTTGRLP